MQESQDEGLIPGLGRSPGEGNGYPLQYSCLENFINREIWQTAVHGVTKESDMTYSLTNNDNKGTLGKKMVTADLQKWAEEAAWFNRQQIPSTWLG